MSHVIVAEGLGKTYQSGGRPLTVLQGVDLTVSEREIVAILGPSGSGKTTLLGLLAGLDTPSRGRVILEGQDLADLDEDDRASFRARNVGFVFQSFHLLPSLTALENVQVPLELLGEGSGGSRRGRALELLDRVGLGERMSHYPAQLSGGEQQRVALARAFSTEPRILFADEPTGNLDQRTGARVIELLEELNAESQTTLVMVTHDMGLAQRAPRVVRLSRGRLVSDESGTPA